MHAFLFALALFAAPPEPGALFADLFAKRLPVREAFTPEFLAAVPPDRIGAIVELYTTSLGDFARADLADGKGTLHFAAGTCACSIAFTGAGKVSGLWLGAPNRSGDDETAILADLAALPGTCSVALLRDGAPLLDLSGDRPLAVGSAFKLYILKALHAAQKEGRLADDHVVPLERAAVSLPTGILQEWPAGTPVTVRALAHLMVSLSDNTATDALLSLLGRPAVEAVAPATMRPLLSTREMFMLKLGEGADGRRAKYIAADEAGRRELLAAHAGVLPALDAAMKWESPIDVDTVEWFASTGQLAATIQELADDPSLAINPGLVRKAEWAKVAYKGGSEPGVLNYTIHLKKRPDSPGFALSATINDPAAPVATDRFNAVVMRLVELIGRGALDGAPGGK